MGIKRIRFIDEIRDVYNDCIDVGVEFVDGLLIHLSLVQQEIYLTK